MDISGNVDKLVAYARNMLVPDNETFQANVTSTYNVIEAGKYRHPIISESCTDNDP
jgi:hypothetical protein